MKNLRQKTSLALGATALIAVLTACGGGSEAPSTSEPVLRTDGSVEVEADTGSGVAASSRSGQTIEEAYLMFWSAVAAQNFEEAAAWSHPEWLAEVGEQYGYQDDPAAAVKAALYSQSYTDAWTNPEYSSGWEAKVAFTSENYPYGYNAELTEDELRAQYEQRKADRGEDAMPFFQPDGTAWTGLVLDSGADEVRVNADKNSALQIVAVNGFTQASALKRGADDGWQFNGVLSRS